MTPLKLLLASDGSDGALAAAHWIATRFSPGDLKVMVASVSRSAIDVGSPTFAPVPAYSKLLEDAAAQDARQACDKTRQVLKRFQAQGVILEGRTIATALIGYAKDHDYEVIATGRRGHTLSHALLGSVSSELCRQSPIPVWVFP